MTTFIALLRAVNVGGTGKLPMTELKALCAAAGFSNPRTYIASGNALFESDLSEAEVANALDVALERYAGKPIGVLARTAAEMAAVAKANPFSDRPRNRVTAVFLPAQPAADALDAAVGVTSEQLSLGMREIYVYFPHGQADSKLRIPAAKAGTSRNLNTVAKLAELAAAPT